MSTKAQAPDPAPRRGRGRPRDDQLRARVLQTAADLAAQSGIDVTFERIAREAGVSRTTLYRWWDSPQVLLLDALLDGARWTIEVSAGEETVARLRRHLVDGARVLSDAATGAPLRALAAGALTREDVRHAFFDHWLAPRRAAAATILDEGVARGEVRPDVDVEVVVDLLFAPLYHRAWLTRAPLDEQVVDEILALVLPSITPPAAGP